MTVFNNLLAAIGGIGNAAGAQGNGPGGINAVQQAALTPEQSLAYGKQTALAKLAADPNFQAMPPEKQTAAVAQITGDPGDLSKAGMQATIARAVPNLPANNPTAAMTKLAALGLAPPDAGVQMSTNPNNMMGTFGSPSASPTALSQVPSAAPSPAATPQTPGASLSNPSTGSGRDEAFLASLPPAYAIHVKAISDGNEDLPTGSEAKDPFWRNVATASLRYDPSLQKQTAGARAKTAADFASGQGAKDTTQINSVIGHLYDLNEAAPGLNATGISGTDSIPILNAGINAVAKGKYGLGLPGTQAYQNYQSILTRAAPELNKFYVGGEGDKEGRAVSGDSFSSNLPVKDIQNNVQTTLGLLGSKSDALQARKDAGMGRATSPILTPISQALVKDLRGEPLSSAEQFMVNARRKQSNLPPKTWAAQPAQQGAPAAARPATPAPAGLMEGQKVRNKTTGQMAVIKNGVPVPLGAQ